MGRLVKRHRAPKTASDGKGAYAELFGRAIYFLTDAGKTLANPQYTAQARQLADAAVGTLFAHGMFRSHGGEDRRMTRLMVSGYLLGWH